MGLCVGLATMFIMHYEVGVYIILNAADGNHRKNIEKLPKFVQDMIRLIQNHHDSQMLGTNFFKALECKFNEDRRSWKQLEFRGFRHFCNATDCYDDLGEYLKTSLDSISDEKNCAAGLGRKIEKTSFLINIPGHTLASYFLPFHRENLSLFDPNVGFINIARREEAGHFLRSYFQSPYKFPAYKESGWTRHGPPYMSRPTFLVLWFFPREGGDGKESQANDGRGSGSIPLKYRLVMDKLCDSRRSCCSGMWTGLVFAQKVFAKEEEQNESLVDERNTIDRNDGFLEFGIRESWNYRVYQMKNGIVEQKVYNMMWICSTKVSQMRINHLLLWSRFFFFGRCMLLRRKESKTKGY